MPCSPVRRSPPVPLGACPQTPGIFRIGPIAWSGDPCPVTHNPGHRPGVAGHACEGRQSCCRLKAYNGGVSEAEPLRSTVNVRPWSNPPPSAGRTRQLGAELNLECDAVVLLFFAEDAEFQAGRFGIQRAIKEEEIAA